MSSEHSFDEKALLESTLRQLLPETVMLVVSSQQRVIVGLSGQEHTLTRFTLSEWKVLLALAESYPHYSPYEVMMSRLMGGPIDYYREHLHAAADYDTWQRELRPVRDALSSLRAKLRRLYPSLVVSSVYQAGYLLATA
jgi:hypothetical protein